MRTCYGNYSNIPHAEKSSLAAENSLGLCAGELEAKMLRESSLPLLEHTIEIQGRSKNFRNRLLASSSLVEVGILDWLQDCVEELQNLSEERYP